jgi:hypothetical protein
LLRVESAALPGNPDMKRACTSHIERKNGTLRQWCKRLNSVDIRVLEEEREPPRRSRADCWHYSFAHIHSALRITTASASIADHLFDFRNLNLSYDSTTCLCGSIEENVGPVSGKPGNGKTLWKIADPLGCEIVLDADTWDHILAGHPEMAKFMDAIKNTIEDPILIQKASAGTAICYYYRLAGRNFYKHLDVYVSVVVERLAKSGRIKTAHLMKHLRRKVEVTLWMKSN